MNLLLPFLLVMAMKAPNNNNNNDSRGSSSQPNIDNHNNIHNLNNNKNINPILQWSAVTLSQKLRTGEVTAVEVMEATLDRVEQCHCDSNMNAIVSLKPRQELLREAAALDRKRAERPDASSTWLWGIPMAIKDIHHVAGLPTTMGGSPLATTRPQETSAPFAQRLQAAGALFIGKSNTPESALGCHTFNNVFGPTRNPFDVTLSAGGSSGGAAAALASHQLCCADGTDMMGSLRNPAGWQQLYSLRPTAGIMEEEETAAVVVDDDDKNDTTTSFKGGNPLHYPISTLGPMARNVEDMERLFETMLPPHQGQKHQQQRQTHGSHAKNTVNNPPFRILWLGDWQGALPVERGILQHCRQTLDKVASRMDGRVELVYLDSDDQSPSNDPTTTLFSLFDMNSLWDSWIDIRSSVIYHAHLEHDGDWQRLPLRDDLKWELQRGRDMTTARLQRARAVAHDYSVWLTEQIFSNYDAIALPSSQTYPFPVEWTWPKVIVTDNDSDSDAAQQQHVKMDTYHRWMQIMVPVSLAGLPCVTVPVGFGIKDNDNGNKADDRTKPMGVQIAGPRGSDALLIQLAKDYERAFHELQT